MNTNLENTQQQPSRVPLFATTLIGLLVFASLQLAHADEWYSAHDTIVAAGIGTNATNYYDRLDDADAGEHHVSSETPKAESIYLHNGKTVCFKLESDVSVAYYCN